MQKNLSAVAPAQVSSLPSASTYANSFVVLTTDNMMYYSDGTSWDQCNGVTILATASGSISAGNLVYIKSDGTAAVADSTAAGKEAIGFVKSAYTNGQTALVWLSGQIIPGLTSLTIGSMYYMSTSGSIVLSGSAPSVTGNILMVVGIALTTTTLLFQPTIPITL